MQARGALCGSSPDRLRCMAWRSGLSIWAARPRRRFRRLGRPIVLVHGLGGSYTNWMAVGGALAGRGRVVAPICSASGAPRWRAANRRSPPTWPSWDGSSITWEPARRRPPCWWATRWAAWSPCSSPPSGPRPSPAWCWWAPRLPRPAGAPFDAAGRRASSPSTPSPAWASCSCPAASPRPARSGSSGTRSASAASTPGSSPAESGTRLSRSPGARRLLPGRTGPSWVGAIDAPHAARRARVEHAIRRVRARTLITQGAEDRLVPVAVSEAAARLQPAFRLEVMAGAGTCPSSRCPRAGCRFRGALAGRGMRARTEGGLPHGRGQRLSSPHARVVSAL